MITVVSNNKPQGQSTQKGVQFLGLKHITNPKGHIFQVKKVTGPDNGGKPDNFGNPYVVFWTMGGVTYSKGYAPTSSALAEMCAFMGADESKWKGKNMLINKEKDEDEGERLTYALSK